MNEYPDQMLLKLIRFFVGASKGHITKTQLVHFLYLADLYAVKWTTQPLTELDWILFKHGPYSHNIEKALGRLAAFGEISYQAEGKAQLIMPAAAFEEAGEFDRSLWLMLENIRSPWIGAPLADLQEYVRSTAPMAAASNHAPEDQYPLELVLEYQRTRERLHSGQF